MNEHSSEHVEMEEVPVSVQHEDTKRHYSIVESAFHNSVIKVPVMKAASVWRRHWVFLLVVGVPTLLVAIYLWFIASPQYTSETHFLVRGKSQSMSGMGGIASLIESSHGGSQDTYAVQDYMTSRDAMQMLVREEGLRGVFNPSYADFWARFPSFFTRKDSESFYQYYRDHIQAQIDAETGISHLKVRAFSAEDAQRIAQRLLSSGERLVNEMNDRQRHNMLFAAQNELNQTFKELHDAEIKLASYRYNNAIIDPMRQATPMVGTAFSLETTLSMIEAEKAQLDRTAPGSPLRQVYEQRIRSLQAQVERAQAHITGQKGLSLVPKLLGYDELEVQRKILEKRLAVETSALEMAKGEADRQMMYVTVVSKPSLPDYPDYPRNTIFLLITFFTALGFYVTGSLLVSGAREHALQ